MARPAKYSGGLCLPFNPKSPTLLHLDLNSCFATIEQQANPLLRGQPIAVAAYTTPSGCILAPSIEAKKVGVKVGMRVAQGQLLCPGLKILPPDPCKYRHIHLQLKKLLSRFSYHITPKSIDEFLVDLEGFPAFSHGIVSTAATIKAEIKAQIGEWLTVSVGIGPNQFLAKLAAGLKKPDGLEEINASNFSEIYSRLSLPDLPGIKQANTARLHLAGIYTVSDFYQAPITVLKSAFHSISGYYWYLRLHGWEVDDVDIGRKSFGNMYSLPRSATIAQISPILHKLVEKFAFRMRKAGFSARGVHLALLYQNRSFWHHGQVSRQILSSSADIYRLAFRILNLSPYRHPITNIAVSCFHLLKKTSLQLALFENLSRQTDLTTAIDNINEKWGNFVITPAAMIGTQNLVPDRISYGGIKEIEQFIFSSDSS